MDTDQRDWFEPRNSEHTDFVQDVNVWIQAAKLRQEESKKISDEIQPVDSVSVTSKKSKKSKSVSVASTISSAHSECLKIELERAALLAKTATLKRKQALKEHKLQLKAEKEELELQAGLAAADARLAVLRKYEGSEASSRTKGSRVDVLMSTSVKHDASYSKSGVANSGSRHSNIIRRDASDHVIQPPVYSVNNSVNTDNLVTIMQSQNDITESLIKQQKLSTLPSQNIPVFKGDPIKYCFFIRAFEHGVESKTENSKDRLYYLEQHTNGQPNDLVRSCFHMDPEQGHPEAERLLKERFGDIHGLP